MTAMNCVARLVAGLVVMLIPYNVHANFIYTYTGNDYELFQVVWPGYTPPNTYDPDNHITAALTFDQRLNSSSNGIVIPLSFIVNDGYYALTQDNVIASSFWFDIDAAGDVIDWSVGVNALWVDGLAHALTLSTTSFGNIPVDRSIDNVCGTKPNFDEIMMCAESSDPPPPEYRQWAEVQNKPGTWTVSQVPEPATLALFGIGLAGFGWSRRKKS